MINRIIKRKHKPGQELAHRITTIVCGDDLVQCQGLYFYLIGFHRTINSIAEACPGAYKDFTSDNKEVIIV